MKNLLAVLGIVLLSAVSVSAAPVEKPAEIPIEAPVTPPATAPDQAPAPQGVACGPVLNTPLFTVGGSTCLQARNDLYGVLTNEANCQCGFCSNQFIYQPCQVIFGGYSVRGYLKYSCTVCIE
jgi:hypothetical protein